MVKEGRGNDVFEKKGRKRLSLLSNLSLSSLSTVDYIKGHHISLVTITQTSKVVSRVQGVFLSMFADLAEVKQKSEG